MRRARAPYGRVLVLNAVGGVMTWRDVIMVGGVAVFAWLAIGAGLMGLYWWRAEQTARRWADKRRRNT